MPADSPDAPPPPGDTERWIEREDRFWKSQKRQHEAWKNLLWLAAGIGLAILLNQLGCAGFSFG